MAQASERKIVPRLLGDEQSTGSVGKQSTGFVGNKIKTSKYTVVTFVPTNLYEQFHKFGNLYFLVLSAMMYAGEHTTFFIGTIKSFSTFGTLVMMMSITAMVAALDDRRRHIADDVTNKQDANRVEDGERKTTEWQDIKVGDVLLVEDGQELPADIVPIFASGDQGSCYVSTANLDGETNLKLKGAPDSTTQWFAQNGGAGLAYKTEVARRKILEISKGLKNVVITAEAPQASIHVFNGNITKPQQNTQNPALEPLEAKHLLLRGTRLRNTAFCVGVVVYTGTDTRMVRNTRAAPLKLSNLEKITNSTMILVLFAQAGLALVSDLTYMMHKHEFLKAWYLSPPDLSLPDYVSYLLTFFVLYSNMMPISLYPTMEWCNYWQTYFIKNDRLMYYKEMDMPAGVRASNLCQELGQVNYIFSDKTGTLTQNVMELKRVVIVSPSSSPSHEGRTYGTVDKSRGFNGAKKMIEDSRNGAPFRDENIKFLEVLAVAHTVMVSEGEGDKLVYEAESPDESALVEAAADAGWKFRDRVRNQIFIDIAPDYGKKKKTLTYTVHAMNAFDSTRKRQSVVVEDENKKYSVLVKGADNVMLDRAANRNKYSQLVKTLHDFSEEGLRTLVIGRRELTEREFDAWKKKYEAASLLPVGRAEALAEVAEEVEKDMELVGATAIEDKLQEGVPQAIENIRKAGINLWVLTGDKLETAKNIGYSSKVLDSRMTIATLDLQPEASNGDDEIEKQLNDAENELKDVQDIGRKALMVTGPTLEFIFKDEPRKKRMLKMAKSCSILIACRVSPLQKAQMVRLVRDDNVTPKPVTLAIGDGANDVPMIQEAQVGVGIAGREGRQAVNNSDFSIGQFKYLENLLFVHGRWNYRRACKFTLFTFWRNAVQVLCIFYYTFVTGFSGTCIFEDWLRLSFNFLCSFPIMATGCFDQDIPADVALKRPDLYEVGRLGLDLNPTEMGKALLSALWHSLVLLFFASMCFGSFDVLDVGDYYTFGTMVFTFLVTDINIRVAFLNTTYNRYTVGAIVGSFVCYCVFLVVYPGTLWLSNALSPNMFNTVNNMVVTPTFWVCCIAVPLVSTTLDTAVLHLHRRWNPRREELASLRDDVKRCGWRGRLIAPDPIFICKPPAQYGEGSGSPLVQQEDKLKEEYKGLITVTPFSQQALQGVFFPSSLIFIHAVIFIVGSGLIVTGVVAYSQSKSVNQIRIEYAGDNASDPWGTDVSDTIKVVCEEGTTCTTTIPIRRDMTAPILVYYAVGPFYQSYNDYLTSEVPKELMGQEVSDAVRDRFCKTKDVREENDRKIIPCGRKAKSMFNDTFTFTDLDVDTSDVGWGSDTSRYKNMDNYGDNRTTVWINETYPDDVINNTLGVKDPRFVEWMRPGATPNLVKRYGWIRKSLKANTSFTLVIKNRFNVSFHGGYKQLILTELNAFGGRNDGVGYAALAGGAWAVVGALVMFAYQSMKNKKDGGSTYEANDGLELTRLLRTAC